MLFKKEYSFLSNFTYVLIRLPNGESYPSVEHAYQALKTLDKDERKPFLTLSSLNSGQAKRAGKKVTLRKNWNFVSLPIMEYLILEKFKDPSLNDRLLRTFDLEIVETNYWHDNFWGNCECPKCINVPGQNNLGKIIMSVRSQLRE